MKKLLAVWTALTLLGLTAGCAAAPEAAPEPPSPVYTDWSQLTPYVPTEPVCTRFEPYSGGESLQAREDYGPLLPYVGAYPDTESYMGPLPLLGLVTAQGALVTDPIYADVHMVTDGDGRGLFLILARGRLLGVTEDGSYPYGNFTYTVAAPDGSWVREFSGGGSYFLLSGTELALACDDGSATVLFLDGETEAYFPREALEPYLGQDFQWTWDGGPSLDCRDGFLCVWRYDENDPEGDHIACYLDVDTGAVSDRPPAVPRDSTGLIMEPPPEDNPPAGYDRQTVLTDPVTGRSYRYAGWYGDPGGDLLDADGNLLREGCQLSYLVLGVGPGSSPWVWGDRIACEEDGFFCYYDLEGRLIFRCFVETNDD